MLTFDDSTASMTFRGKLNLINSNKDYALLASGVGYAKPDSSIYELNTLLAFDIVLPEKALNAMAEDIVKYAKMAPQALDGSREELYKIGEFVGSSGAQDYANRKGNNTSLLRLSNKLQHTIVLNKANLVWSEKQRAWYSTGKIGLASIAKTDVNALIDGYIEIKKEAGVDAWSCTWRWSRRPWYYFKYANNALLTKAQHGSYDELIGQKAKGDYNTATTYGFFLGDDQEVDQFVTHFRKDYLGETGKRKVAATPVSSGNFDFTEDTGKKKKRRKARTTAPTKCPHLPRPRTPARRKRPRTT